MNCQMKYLIYFERKSSFINYNQALSVLISELKLILVVVMKNIVPNYGPRSTRFCDNFTRDTATIPNPHDVQMKKV